MRQNIVFLAFWISLVSGAAPIPGFRGGGKGPKDTPDTPDTPDPPSPGGRPNEEGPGGGGSPYYNPNDLYHGTPQGGAVNPNQVPTQAQLQSNNQVLEESLEVVHNALDAVQQIVDGFLKTPDAKSSTVEVEGPVLPSTWANPTTTTPQPLTFTPTTTLASTSFTACKSYASILFSCAATTSGFYSLQPTAQASCVCYATREATIPCNSGRGTQAQHYPLWIRPASMMQQTTVWISSRSKATRTLPMDFRTTG
ncbi:hypothetical protein BCR34DRAFT_244266 [Clohesyomyces aquaticus]|uniref:Uncharacterized protein n=1 Tax=Clohesyomyces aquaticus TaxID=1231657 RepID=A0A1Y1ZUW6_9PLEO|nr:hypothetical protein BCR34DRAFT_244266 [Clohesyomyces aquaticus]